MDGHFYIGSIKDSITEIIKSMTAFPEENISLTSQQYPQQNINFSYSYLVSFSSPDQKLSGDFILGFVNEEMAIKFSDHLAKNLDLPSITAIDEWSTALLGEFLVILSKRIISKWQSLKLDIKTSYSVPINNCLIKPLTLGFTDNFDLFDVSLVGDDDSHQIQVFFASLLSCDSCHSFHAADIFKISDGKAPGLWEQSLDFSKYVLQALPPIKGLSRERLISSKNNRVLIIESSKTVRFALSNLLREKGLLTETASNGLEGLLKFNSFRPMLTIIGEKMTVLDGFSVVEIIGKSYANANLIVLNSPDISKISQQIDEIISRIESAHLSKDDDKSKSERRSKGLGQKQGPRPAPRAH